VAQGAALYAATAGVDGRARPQEAAPSGPRVWLQHPAVSSDPGPFVVGRVLDRGKITAVQVCRLDGGWKSGVEMLDGEGAFALPVELVTRQSNDFRVDGLTPDALRVPLHPPRFRIVHGVTVTDPPLSRTIGVALADDSVRVYFERGSPLPMRRTFTHTTVETLARGSGADVLKVPIVQGEYGLAHLCRLVGSITIPGDQVKAALPAGATVEITLELDRGGQLSARATVPFLEQTFEHVAVLLVPRLSIEAMVESLGALQARANAAQADAFRRGDPDGIVKLGEAARLLAEAERDLAAARGGDADAGEKARRAVLEVDATLAELEAAQAWPLAVEAARHTVATAAGWVGRYGDETERKIFRDAVARIDQLVTARKAADVEREARAVEQLGNACYYRSPGAWETQFDWYAARVSEATDLRRATALVKDGRSAIQRGDTPAVETALRGLWQLLPPSAEDRRLGHDSGVR
jgi:molecular chaperone DnaK